MPTILNDLKCMSTIEKLKLLLRCVIFVACSCALSTMLHAFDSAFIQDVHGKPSFVSDNLMFFSVLEKTSFVIAYIILGYQLPIKNHVLRGFTYMMLICISNYLPQVMGLAGADSEIAEVAFGCFIISGIFIAIFYRMTEYNKASDYGWLLFGLKYSLLIWSPIVLIMIAFGTDILSTVVYTFIFIFCITAISWVNGRLLRE